MFDYDKEAQNAVIILDKYNLTEVLKNVMANNYMM